MKIHCFLKYDIQASWETQILFITLFPLEMFLDETWKVRNLSLLPILHPLDLEYNPSHSS